MDPSRIGAQALQLPAHPFLRLSPSLQARSACASGSLARGRSAACAGKTRSRRSTASRGSPPSARPSPRWTGYRCVSDSVARSSAASPWPVGLWKPPKATSNSDQGTSPASHPSGCFRSMMASSRSWNRSMPPWDYCEGCIGKHRESWVQASLSDISIPEGIH